MCQVLRLSLCTFFHVRLAEKFGANGGGIAKKFDKQRKRNFAKLDWWQVSCETGCEYIRMNARMIKLINREVGRRELLQQEFYRWAGVELWTAVLRRHDFFHWKIAATVWLDEEELRQHYSPVTQLIYCAINCYTLSLATCRRSPCSNEAARKCMDQGFTKGAFWLCVKHRSIFFAKNLSRNQFCHFYFRF